VVLPGVDVDKAVVIANQIRESFAEWTTQPDSPTDGKTITASLGASAVEFNAKDATAMVDQADQALYHSKTHGRNQVSNWADLPAKSGSEMEQVA
jgi:diguanylate cyclase (GGDEF)-like protein